MTMVIERFLLWARTAPVARRTEAAAAMARAYLHSPLEPDQRDGIEAAMTVLLDDSAPEVRVALAEELCTSDHAPHHVILLLASDRPAIARIVVEHSPLILDSELVDLIGGRDEVIQCAAARRPYVSRAVSAAISEVGSAAACLALLANGGARVPRFSLDRIIERHGDCPELRSFLLDREDLPIDIRQILLARLTASLRDMIVGHAWLTPARADSVTRDARERATIAAAFEAPADSMPSLVRRLLAAGELTPAFLIRAAASGQVLLFETALAELANVAQPRVAALIASGRTASLTALLQRSGLAPETFPAFTAAAEVLRRSGSADDAMSDYRRATHIIDAIVSRYQERRDRELDGILQLLRQFATEAKRAAARGYAQQVLEAA